MFNWFFEERERWFLWLPVLMAGGATLYFQLPHEPSLWLLFTIPLFAVLAFGLRHHHIWQPVAAALLALSCGFGAAQIETRLAPPQMLDAPLPPTAISGFVYHTEPLAGGATRLTLSRPMIKALPDAPPMDFVRIKIEAPYQTAPAAGSFVSLWGPLWPTGEAATPDGFDFRRHAYFNRLGASGMNYGELRTQTPLHQPDLFKDRIALLFEKARCSLTLISLKQLPPDVGAVTAALLTGAQGGIERTIIEDMRASGLSHLLSISGLHVSMVGLLVFLPIRFLLALWPWFALHYSTKKTAAIAAMAATALYTVLIGPEAPVLRSALMSGCMMFAILMDRRSQSLRLVALAAMIILLLRPSSVLSPSFQLSFAAVLAMVAAFERRLDETITQGFSFDLPRWLSRSLRGFRDLALTSVIATVATAPFTLYHFQNLSLYGVAANILAVPLTTFWIMPNLLLTYLMAPFGLAGWFLSAGGWGCQKIIAIASTVANWPQALITTPPMPLWAFGSFVAGFLWLCLWRGRVRWLGLLPVAFACFYPLIVTQPSVFVSADGKTWAVRLEDGRLATYGKRNATFTLRLWQQRSRSATLVLFSKKEPPDPATSLTCEGGLCLFQKGSTSIAFLTKRAKDEAIKQACTSSAIVIAPIPLTQCAARHVIDSVQLNGQGAHTITFEGETYSIQSARTARGLRPWSEGWQKINISAQAPQDDLEP